MPIIFGIPQKDHQFNNIFSRTKPIQYTVPLETIDPFAAVLPRSIRGSTPRFHLENDAACRKFPSVLPQFTAACDFAVDVPW